jgi:hypothetical protein
VIWLVDYIINHRVIWLVGFMVFIATFINISVMYRGGQLDHLTLYTSLWMGFELTTSVVIGTDCIGSCKFNYHTITATTAPGFYEIKLPPLHLPPRYPCSGAS